MKYLITSLVLTLALNLSAQSSISIDLISGEVISNTQSVAPSDSEKMEAYVWSKLKTFFGKDVLPAKSTTSVQMNGSTYQVLYNNSKYTLTVDGVIELERVTTIAAIRTTAAVAAFKELFGHKPS